MTDKEGSPQSMGGVARRESLTPDARREIAKAAAVARWGAGARASHEGVLKLGEAFIPCYVLGDGRRVLSLAGMIGSLGMSKGSNPSLGGDRLANFSAGKGINPFLSAELVAGIQNPVSFQMLRGGSAKGYEASVLAGLCEAIIEADRADALQTQQKRIAQHAWVLMKGFSRVGIVALVDEATGYQYDRARDELQKILAAYIGEELRPWVRRFSHEFYKHVFRLHGWEYRPGSVKGPAYMGKFINNVVYEQLPPGVLEELRRKNPAVEGKRKHRHHQFLTDETGVPHLDRQIIEVTALMKAAHTKQQFHELFYRAFPKKGKTIPMALLTA